MKTLRFFATGGRGSRSCDIYDLGVRGEETYEDTKGMSASEIAEYVSEHYVDSVVGYIVQGIEYDGLSVQVMDKDDNVVFEDDDYDVYNSLVKGDLSDVEAADHFAEEYVDDFKKGYQEFYDDYDGDEIEMEENSDALSGYVATHVIKRQTGLSEENKWCEEGHKLYAHTSDLYGTGGYVCDIELEDDEDFNPDKLQFVMSDYDGNFPYCIDSILPVIKYGNKVYALEQDEWEEHYGYDHFVSVKRKGRGNDMWMEFEKEDNSDEYEEEECDMDTLCDDNEDSTVSSDQDIETEPVSDSRFCGNCGAKIDKDAVFCPECGTPTGLSSIQKDLDKQISDMQPDLDRQMEELNKQMNNLF